MKHKPGTPPFNPSGKLPSKGALQPSGATQESATLKTASGFGQVGFGRGPELGPYAGTRAGTPPEQGVKKAFPGAQ